MTHSNYMKWTLDSPIIMAKRHKQPFPATCPFTVWGLTQRVVLHVWLRPGAYVEENKQGHIFTLTHARTSKDTGQSTRNQGSQKANMQIKRTKTKLGKQETTKRKASLAGQASPARTGPPSEENLPDAPARPVGLTETQLPH